MHIQQPQGWFSPVRRWAQPVQSLRLAARAVGMGIFAIIQRDDRPKVLVYKSRSDVLSRSVVHVLPAAVTVALAYINFRGHFIGRELQGPLGTDDIKMSALQVAAKLQVRSRPPSLRLACGRDRVLTSSLLLVLGATHYGEHRVDCAAIFIFTAAFRRRCPFRLSRLRQSIHVSQVRATIRPWPSGL